MKFGQTDPRLVLKVTPPRVAKSVFVRQRLSSDNPELAEKSFIVVNARSGFGKTTLLAQWRREALQRGAVVAWLSVDESDQPLRLVAGLALAMKAASGRAAFGQINFAPAGDDEAGLEGLTEWLSEVAGMASDTVLIIDDAHFLPEISAKVSIAYLMHNAPANLKVILGARGELGLPVADWVAHGQFASLGADDLRLRMPETIALLRGRFGSRIDADACASLHELTEGWPLGLQLAVATIEKHGSLREAIAAISARSGDIRRYFVECLIERLPLDLADFLVRIAIIDEVHPDLCRAITGRADSAELLARLFDATPIFTQGVGSEWQRMHLLAQDFLRERFALLPAAERRDMQARAARWLADNAMYEAAARHSLAAGDIGMAYDLAEQGLYSVVTSGHVARAAEWIEKLPPEEILRRPRLRLTVGWLLALSERHAEAVAMVTPLLADETATLDDRCESATISGAAAYFADDLVAIERVISPWLGVLDARAPSIRANFGNQMAALMLYEGAPDRARRHYQRAMPAETAGFAYIQGWADWQIGFSYLWEGQIVNAEDALRSSLERAESTCGRRSPIAVMLASALATALWERDQTEEAGAVLANRLDILERHGAPEAIMMGIVTTARLAAVGGLERRAYDLLDNLCALGEARALPRLCVASLAEEIRMHALRSRGDACATLLARLEAIPLDSARKGWGGIEALVDIQLGMARAYAALARNDWPQVMVALEAPGHLADARLRGRDGLQIRLLRALALKRCGEDADGLMAETISLAAVNGFQRLLADTHPDLIDWARRIRNPEHGDPAEGAGLTDQPSPRVREAAAIRVSPTALLTPKEREILRLLASNLSNKQIGLALGVSDETIKWHLKNLFSKLNAGTRQHLLNRARMLGILDGVA